MGKARLGIVLGLAAGLMLFSAAARAAEGTLIDEVAAGVNAFGITRSQVIQEARLILLEKGQNWAGKLPAPLLETVLQRLIGKELLYQEMERLYPPRPGDPQVFDHGALLAQFQRKFSSASEYRRFLAALAMAEESLAALLRRNARIEDFMRRRLEILSRVSAREVAGEVERRKTSGRIAREDQVNGKELEGVVRREMEKARYEESLVRWIRELTARGQVRRLAYFTEDEPAIGARPETGRETHEPS